MDLHPDYIFGHKLWGDNMPQKRQSIWRESEKEAYADLVKEMTGKPARPYPYEKMDIRDWLKRIPDTKLRYGRIASFGGADGSELDVIDNIRFYDAEKMFVFEPSRQVWNKRYLFREPYKNGIYLEYPEPFDLITCFNTLHHIPNVTDHIESFCAALNEDGYLVLREPINHMGDWTKPRPGLTKYERGIHLGWLINTLHKVGFEIDLITFNLTAYPFMQRTFGRFFKKPLLSYSWYLKFDQIISWIAGWQQYRYLRTKWWHNLAPTSVTIIAKKAKP